MGLPDEVIASLAAVEPAAFEVWPVNMPAVDTWLTIDTQWRTASLADGRVFWVGLDYGAVRAGLEMDGAAIDTKIWTGIRLMERAAAAALNGN